MVAAAAVASSSTKTHIIPFRFAFPSLSVTEKARCIMGYREVRGLKEKQRKAKVQGKLLHLTCFFGKFDLVSFVLLFSHTLSQWKKGMYL